MPQVSCPRFAELRSAKEQLSVDPSETARTHEFDPGQVDVVMQSSGLGDARFLLWGASMVDDGDQVLTLDELARGAQLVCSPARRQLEPSVATGYVWNPDDVDAVMRQFAVADARLLIRMATSVDDGDHALSRQELTRAARQMSPMARDGFRWSPSILAKLMGEFDIESETALLAEARRHDHNGNKWLDRDELRAAAQAISGILPAQDVEEIARRCEALRGLDGVQVEVLGYIDEVPMYALHFAPLASESDERSPLNVLITAGVHGDEPCGPANAMLFADQLLADPELRRGTGYTLVPMVNPNGLHNATRRNHDCKDINRSCLDPSEATEQLPREVVVSQRVFEDRTFDLGLDLHSGQAERNGFWLLYDGDVAPFAEGLDALGERWALLQGDTGSYSLARPGLGTSTNAATYKGHMLVRGASSVATLEATGSVSYLDQVIGQNEMMRAIIGAARRQRAANLDC